MSEGTIKQVKVDNWGIFFLQRLQQLFSKSEQCDLVLQFGTNEKVKVHRLVLNACTEYFQILEKQGYVTGDTLRMPSDLQPDVVVPIINFMYTGRLEFRTELHRRLYSTAQQMNMTVLTKLLDAQNSATSTPVKPLMRRPSAIPITYNLQGKKITPKQIDPDLPETLPGRKLPIWKRRNVPANVPAYYDEPSSVSDYESSSRMPTVVIDESPRPTRFEWPEENVDTPSYSSSFDDLSYETKPLVKPFIYSVNKPTIPKADTFHRVATFEEVCRTATNMKRMPSSPSSQDETASKKAKILDLQAVKELVQEHRLRKDLMETGDDNCDEVDDDLAVADMDDDDDMEDEEGDMSLESVAMSDEAELSQQQQQQQQLQQPQPPTPPLPPLQQQLLLQQQEQQQQHQEQQIPSISLPSLPSVEPARPSILPPQKSILKPQGSHEEAVPSTPMSVASKKVRFLLDPKSPKSPEGKENAAATPSTTKIRRVEDGQRPLPTRADNIASIGGAVANTGGNLSNHAKIITEVLKKYPHLVKNNKNIRLKIMQRAGAPVSAMPPIDGDASKMVKSKVSYVVLKSDVAGKGKPAVVLKHGGHVEPLSELGGQKPASGAENTTGPWLCHSCGSNEEPVHFDTYYLYRRHLQDVHMEKIDARICEHCGHRASKRNLLLYHLYTKHGVPPPRNCQFPKCDQCDYVALSESLLIKHRNNHSNNKEFVCKVCNATFKSNGALQGHMQTNLHSDPAKKLYECPFCQKPFVRNINLKAHIRTSHKAMIRKLGEDEDKRKHFTLPGFEDSEEAHSSDVVPEEEEEVEMVEVPVIDAVVQKPVLPSGVTVLAEAPAVQSLVPSSEAEALSNVASGIAASLGLADTLVGEQTVIVLDENQEFVLQSTEIVGEETTGTEGFKDVANGLQEYIVPEIMPDEGQEQQDQAYTGPLSDLEHFPGETAPSMEAVPPPQTATAPPPVSVAVSMVGGDEVTMVLTDHDYAPIRDTNGEGVMFFIARPPAQTEAQEAKCPSEPELPILEKEAPLSSGLTEDMKYSMPPVLTREEEHLVSDGIITQDAEPNTDDVVVTETVSSVENLDVGAAEGVEVGAPDPEVKVLVDNTSENVSATEDITMEVEVEGEDGKTDKQASVRTYSPVKKTVANNSAQQRRQSPVQMADIMKEWDDFDDDEDNASQSANRVSVSEEPKVLRGPIGSE
ncbi:centrosome-associated zinc finger protein Cp190 [Periplaneta americana]|uniref:centrosome-associated zinc finger protein Cp190 n=1 Tax=Periplaneta americana TaxID=6978 RepID=UPI0037E8E3B1